jgi:hypothetical protein
MKNLTGALAAGVAAILAAAASAASAAAALPFYPIHREQISVPASVEPWLPTWTAKGDHIVFQNQLDGTTWTVSKNGGDARCITCGFADRPKIVGGFTYAFPDERRLLLTPEIGASGGADPPSGADGYVLECAPSILRCSTHRYLPIDMSADKGGAFIIQRRTWHLAPDGVHLAWTDLRTDGTVMVIARLVRRANEYVAAAPRSVNPVGPGSPDDANPDHWANSTQLYELKSFADGGRSVLAVAEPAFNTDVLKINLATGATTRLTANPDWDEDGAISPDGDLYTLYSWRTRHRLEATAWLPQLRSFEALPFAAALAPYYVSSWQGFQCDLSPWLLSAAGDGNGTLIGQPLNTFSGNLTAGNNLSGAAFWSPDSTSVLLQERLRTPPGADANPQVAQKGLVPHRILIAHIDRRPTKALRVVNSAVGSWAPSAIAYHGAISSATTVVVKGSGGGTATLAFTGNLIGGASSTTFNHYSDDGTSFVDGSYAVSDPDAATFPWHITANITISGAHSGSLQADLTIDNTKAVPTKSGTFTAVYDGHTAPALPALGPCYQSLPRPSRLHLAIVRRSRTTFAVTVSADVYGDSRPVQNALVTFAGLSARTDAHGRAIIRVHARGKRARTVIASAGDTFIPARAHVRLGN